MMIYVWLGILVATVILEIATTQMVSIWFAIGALAAFIAALLGVEQLWIQIVAKPELLPKKSTISLLQVLSG